MAARTNEPATAPQAEHWYPLVLGSSLKDQPSKRFYSLRYEFKPASIDTSQPGTLHKGVENKVTVEFSNNQPGKPKVAFQGISEDCKDSDAILFFDGKTFRMERLHRAVKTLRHMRQPGESASGAAAAGLASGSAIADTRSSPVHLNGTSADDTNAYRGPRQEHVEEIVIGSQPEGGGGTKKKNGNKAADSKTGSKAKASPAPSPPLDRKRGHAESPTLDDETAPDNTKKLKQDNVELIDVNVNIDDEAGEEHESDYELEDVDVSEDEDGQLNKSATDPVEALRAQAAAAANTDKPQSSSASGSSSSGSGSDSSSDSDGSEDESGSLGDI